MHTIVKTIVCIFLFVLMQEYCEMGLLFKINKKIVLFALKNLQK